MTQKFVTVTWPSVTEQKDKFNFGQSSISRQPRGSAFSPISHSFLGMHRHSPWVLLLPKSRPRAEGSPVPVLGSMLWDTGPLQGSLRTMPEERQMLQISTAHERLKTLFILPTDHLQTVLVFFPPAECQKELQWIIMLFKLLQKVLKGSGNRGTCTPASSTNLLLASMGCQILF